MNQIDYHLERTIGVKVVESELAMVQAVELWDSTKEFCSNEFISQFNDWSLRTFGKKPGAFYMDTNYSMILGRNSGQRVLLVHPQIRKAIQKIMEPGADQELGRILAGVGVG